jgi:hypothetical protein
MGSWQRRLHASAATVHLCLIDTPPPPQDALLRMDASALSVEQLSVLSRAVPDDQERKDVELYLAGAHPKYRFVPAC